ncbi:MAG: response regulator [Pseudomonadota bacterium]
MAEVAGAETGHLLLVDDDPEIRELTTAYLEKQGFTVAAVESGEAMDSYLEDHEIDLIVLDLMLPGEHGLSIARRIKGTLNLPVIIVSAQGEDVDRIVGLEIGADDYLGKPFNPRELLARIRAVLRRVRAVQPVAAADRPMRFGEFEFDRAAHRLSRNGVPVALTTGEFDLLAVLVSEPNRVLDRDRILDRLTGAERSPFDRSIDVRITRLRGKIEADPSAPRFIRTVWGKGYMFCPDGGA